MRAQCSGRCAGCGRWRWGLLDSALGTTETVNKRGGRPNMVDLAAAMEGSPVPWSSLGRTDAEAGQERPALKGSPGLWNHLRQTETGADAAGSPGRAAMERLEETTEECAS